MISSLINNSKMKNSNFVLTPKHKFILLATAVAVEEETDSEYHIAAQCAITTPVLQKDLIDNGYIKVDMAFVPSLTNRGLEIVQQMLHPTKPIEKVVVPYALHQFKKIPNNRLVQLLLDTTEAIKTRAFNSAPFADSLVNNQRISLSYTYLKSLSPIFEAEAVINL